jgi:hypothetical protein
MNGGWLRDTVFIILLVSFWIESVLVLAAFGDSSQVLREFFGSSSRIPEGIP